MLTLVVVCAGVIDTCGRLKTGMGGEFFYDWRVFKKNFPARRLGQ